MYITKKINFRLAPHFNVGGPKGLDTGDTILYFPPVSPYPTGVP